MNIKNNNTQVIKNIAKSSLKTNKTRNIFAILAICMATFMITTVFTICLTFIHGYPIMNYRLQGTTATANLRYPTDEQIEIIDNLEIVKSTGLQIYCGKIFNEEFNRTNKKISLYYYDEDNYNKQIVPSIDEVEGSYPTKYNEIMIPQSTLQTLAWGEYSIGDTVSFTYETGNEIFTETFNISGTFNSFQPVDNSGHILMSKAFTDKHNITKEDNGRLYITINKKYYSEATDILDNSVILNGGQIFSYSFNANADIKGVTIDITIIGLIIISFIMLCGFLLIYNIFQISIIRDINFYGLLKTIGTSPKQLAKIVKLQAFYLSIIGILIGLVLSTIISFVLTPMFLSTFYTDFIGGNCMPSDAYFSPVLYVFSVVFSFITVSISCRKPAKMVSNISPIEALKFTGNFNSKKVKKLRNSTNGGKIYKMAWYNVFRIKSKAIIVFLSLFMGIITFLSINTLFGGLKTENYLNTYMPDDFSLYNNSVNKTDVEDLVGDEFLEKLESLDGIKSVVIQRDTFANVEPNKIVRKTILNMYDKFSFSEKEALDFYLEYENNVKDYKFAITTFDDSFIEEIYNQVGGFDIEAYKRGEVALISKWYFENEDIEFSDKITVLSLNGETKKEMNIAIIDNSSILSSLYSQLGLFDICVNNKVFDELGENALISKIKINVLPEYMNILMEELRKLSIEYNLSFQSKIEVKNFFNKSMRSVNLLFTIFGLTLIFVGILNFINVIATSINSRTKELALLESIGMTKKQIIKMLMYEGLYYAIITCILLLTVGSVIIHFMAILTLKIADYAVYNYPLNSLIFVTIIIFIICLVTPMFIYKQLSKESIVERISKANS